MNETGKAPTSAQVDARVSAYAEAKREADAVGAVYRLKCEAAETLKAELVAMVQVFGQRHTEKSQRLAGVRTSATITTATRVSVDPAAVEAFRGYLVKRDMVEICGRFFVAHTTYSLVEGPEEVLKTLSLAKRVREKVASLISLCFQIKTNAPSLKVEVAEPLVDAR